MDQESYFPKNYGRRLKMALVTSSRSFKRKNISPTKSLFETQQAKKLSNFFLIKTEILGVNA